MKRFMFLSIGVWAATIVLIVAASATNAQTPAHFWSQRFGGAGNDWAYAVAVDASGNVYVTGHFSGTVDFGGGNLVSAGSYDIFLAKYFSNGAHCWSKRFGGTSLDQGYAVAVDAGGTVCVTGRFNGTVDFGGGPLVSAGADDIFLASYSSNVGTYLWSQRFGGTGNDRGDAVAVDALGDVYVTGQFNGTVDFGGGPLVSAGGDDIFLAKYNSFLGGHLWSQRFGGAGNDWAYAVAVDASGNVYMTGGFFESADFGGGSLAGIGFEIFLAKYNSNGAHLWSQRFGGTNTEIGNAVAVDASGNVYVTGYFNDTVDFGGGPLVSAGGDDIFLAKYDLNGTHLWSQRFGGTGNDRGHAVAVDASGNAFVTGYFFDSADFGGWSLVGIGFEIFLAKYNSNGAHLWSQRFGGTNTDIGEAVAVDASGNVYVTGHFSGLVDFGGGSLAGTNFEIFLAKYGVMTAEPIITSIADIGNDQGRKVKIRFSRSGVDDGAASYPVTFYEAFRRDDIPPGATGTLRDPSWLSSRRLFADGWTQVGSVAAHGDATYGIDVPTIGDSTLTLGQYYSVFFVRAATNRPSVFYDSPADSGYSLDNLAPGVPVNLAYSAGQLSWDKSSAEDFDYFTVYGSNTDDFGAATVVDYTVAPTMDVTASPYTYYYVTATDFSSNEGRPGSLNTATGVGGTPLGYVLSVSNYPNPFNPSTTVKYTVPERGLVTVTIYDARGARVVTLVNHEHEAGAYATQWSGRSNVGTMVSSGVYFARVTQNGTARLKKMVLLK